MMMRSGAKAESGTSRRSSISRRHRSDDVRSGIGALRTAGKALASVSVVEGPEPG